jgi:hypothetical protein
MSVVKSKSGILILLCIVSLYFGLDRLLAYGLNRLKVESNYRFSRLYRGGLKKDVVVLGNSRGVNAIYSPAVEELTGKSCMNISYNGMSSLIADNVLRDYLDRNEPPRVIILEITNLVADQGLLADLKLYSGESGRLRKLILEFNPNIYRSMAISKLFQFNGEMFLRCLYYLRRDDQSWINRNSIDLGYVKKLRVNKTKDSLENLTKAENVEALKRILRLCEERKIGIRLIISPYLPQYLGRLEGFKEWKERIQYQVGAENRIWDYSSALDDVKYFADPLHMNLSGSMKFLLRAIDDGFFNW